MQNQSSIFILYGFVDGEGNTTLGAYTSYDKAALALDAYKTELVVDRIRVFGHSSVYDDYLIEETVLNMPVID